MKKIGLIGGMSFESTIPYYKIINEEINKTLGGLNSAEIILYSVNFCEIEECQKNNDWEKSAQILTQAGLKLQNAGADFILICTNTMHKIAPQIQSKLKIPIIHIAQSTSKELIDNNIETTALLGTKYTMQEDFYKKILIENGINVLIPEKDDIEIINKIIFNELCCGIIKKSSKEKFLEIIKKLQENGAQGVVLGCTEIGLLIEQKDVAIKVFDTTIIHSKHAAKLALE